MTKDVRKALKEKYGQDVRIYPDGHVSLYGRKDGQVGWWFAGYLSDYDYDLKIKGEI